MAKPGAVEYQGVFQFLVPIQGPSLTSAAYEPSRRKTEHAAPATAVIVTSASKQRAASVAKIPERGI